MVEETTARSREKPTASGELRVRNDGRWQFSHETLFLVKKPLLRSWWTYARPILSHDF